MAGTNLKTARRRLPNRRGSEAVALEVGGLSFATESRFDDGSLSRVFLQNHKADSTAVIMASDAAIGVSLPAQLGCPLETLRKVLRRDVRGNAIGPFGSLVDADDKAA